MTSPYPTNQVSVVVTDDLHGKLLSAVDADVTEKSPGDAVTMHAVDAARLKAAGLVEDAIAVAHTIPDQTGDNGEPFSYVIPENTFSGGFDNVLSATKGDGSALPGWMAFDPDTRTLSGTAETGTTAVKITATSRGGQTISDTFNVTISA